MPREDQIIPRRENFPFGSDIVPLPERQAGGFQKLPLAQPGIDQSMRSPDRPMNQKNRRGQLPPQFEFMGADEAELAGLARLLLLLEQGGLQI